MTISTNSVRNEYTATASQTTFSYTFKIYSDTAGEDINVYQTPSGQDFDDSADLITAYSITGAGLAAGGTIVLDTGATVGDRITIVSAIDEARTTDYQNSGDFAASTVNDDFDRAVSLVKQQSEKLDRCLQLPESVQTTASVELPTPAAGAFVRWNSGLTGLENVVLSTASDATNAASVSYSNSTSGLTATDVQAAIDEIQACEPGTEFGNSTETGTRQLVVRGGGAITAGGSIGMRTLSDTGGSFGILNGDGSFANGLNINANAGGVGINGYELFGYGSTSGSTTLLSVTTTGFGITIPQSASAISTTVTAISFSYTEGTFNVPVTAAAGLTCTLPPILPEYTVAGVPSASTYDNGVIIVSNESTMGRTLATSDGTNWRRVTDGAIVS